MTNSPETTRFCRRVQHDLLAQAAGEQQRCHISFVIAVNLIEISPGRSPSVVRACITDPDSKGSIVAGSDFDQVDRARRGSIPGQADAGMSQQGAKSDSSNNGSKRKQWRVR